MFLFHPGLQKHRAWLSDSSIETVVAGGAPVVVASYEQDESEIERWVAECHGFTTTADVLLNPLFLDFSADHSVARWGRALWRLGPVTPGYRRKVDTDRLAALDNLAHMVMQAVAQARTPSHAYGAEVEFRAAGGAGRRLYYLTDDYFLDPVDGNVLAFRDGELLVAAHTAMQAVLAHPGKHKSDLERALWAAGIWSRYLEHLYPQAVDDASRRALARSMHASLESRVDEIFGVGPAFDS